MPTVTIKTTDSDGLRTVKKYAVTDQQVNNITAFFNDMKLRKKAVGEKVSKRTASITESIIKNINKTNKNKSA